jgi:hypothetical protein
MHEDNYDFGEGFDSGYEEDNFAQQEFSFEDGGFNADNQADYSHLEQDYS